MGRTERIPVLHVIDSLDRGGAERVAVNLANLLPRERYNAYLCVTRRQGPLAAEVASHVGQFCLHRRQRFDPVSVIRLAVFIRTRRVRVVHAHSSSLFVALVAGRMAGKVRVVWHDHYGGLVERSRFLYGIAARCADAVIAVSDQLARWATEALRVPSDRVWYIPNFSVLALAGKVNPELPGRKGVRIVQLANLRPPKDHLTSIQAMTLVIKEIPDACLLLAGAESDQAQAQIIRRSISEQGLDGHVAVLGERSDTADILRCCDIGILTSRSEGLPLSLIEYGLAGLAAVSTDVGQCAEVLANGTAGRLVPPGDPQGLAEAVVSLLRSPEERVRIGNRLKAHVTERYNPQSTIDQICAVYDSVLGSENGTRPWSHATEKT